MEHAAHLDIHHKLSVFLLEVCHGLMLTRCWLTPRIVCCLNPCCFRMFVVAQDAVPVDPQEVASIQINNGQRYDVLVCQANTSALSTASVWIRAVMIDEYFPTPSAWNTSLGVLYYGTHARLPNTQSKYRVPILTPSRRPVPGKVVNPYSMKPVGSVVPPEATRNISFVIDFYNEPKGSQDTTQYVARLQYTLSVYVYLSAFSSFVTDSPRAGPVHSHCCASSARQNHCIALEF